ncbi:MAG: DUF2202 domain-containing protein [Propionicimonas sp.]
MNATWKTRTAMGLAAAVLTTIGWASVAQAAPTPFPNPPIPPATATATADAALVRNLTFLRQEEQLARDVYTALASKYSQAAPFVNIATSEQRHFDTLGLLLARYGIADPAAGHGAGSYADADLQVLHATLVATGSESLAKAYEVGITIENKDIADLEAAIAQTTQADAKAAFANLLNGSENHLAAFTAAKDGKILGTQNGQGMQHGRNRNEGTQPSGPGRQGQGTGQATGQGTGIGRGHGIGRVGDVDRPANCPAR